MLEFLRARHERNHDLGEHLDPAARHAHCRLENRARLHLGDLGIRDAEAAAAVTQHWVGLAKRFDNPVQLVARQA